jgi:hypothetical protein
MPVGQSWGPKIYVGEYDFAVDGGLVSTIILRNVASSAGPIPTGSIIQMGHVEVLTAVASATGTVALQVESAADILAATGAAGLTLGVKSIIPAGTGATAVKTTAERSPAMVIATAALTAGKFRLRLWYF